MKTVTKTDHFLRPFIFLSSPYRNWDFSWLPINTSLFSPLWLPSIVSPDLGRGMPTATGLLVHSGESGNDLSEGFQRAFFRRPIHSFVFQMLSFKNKRDLRAVFVCFGKQVPEAKGMTPRWKFKHLRYNKTDFDWVVYTIHELQLLFKALFHKGKKTKTTPCFSLILGKNSVKPWPSPAINYVLPTACGVTIPLGGTGRVRLFLCSNGAIYSPSEATTAPPRFFRFATHLLFQNPSLPKDETLTWHLKLIFRRVYFTLYPRRH